MCYLRTLLLVLVASPVVANEPAASSSQPWPMFGGSPFRNMVNRIDKKAPTDWLIDGNKSKNVKWVADLGTNSSSTPSVADGMIFIGSSNGPLRDPNLVGNFAMLRAFRERDGELLWHHANAYPANAIFQDVRRLGLFSTPAVEGNRLYYVTPSCEVVCADVKKGTVAWSYDMMQQLKVVPYHANSCSPLIVGDLVFITTANGTNGKGQVVSPNAPSFIALHKKTGKLAWQSGLPGNNIIDGQWSSPALAVVNGRSQVIFGGGDGVIYSFDPPTGKLLWKCDCNPDRNKQGGLANLSYPVATPVIVGDKLYIGLGVCPEHRQPPRFSYFLCLDVTRQGDVSFKSYDSQAAENKGSALVWAFGGMIQPLPPRGRRANFGPTLSTAAVADGLVYLSEEMGYFHCLDAGTGKRFWQHDFKSTVWSSPLWVDDKIYIGTEDGEIVVFAHGQAKKVLAAIEMGEPIHAAPVLTNGVLYVATRSKLYAIGRR